MWPQIQQFMEFISGVLILLWGLTGAYFWMRYGSEGVYFACSREFPESLHEWQARRLADRRMFSERLK